MAVNFPNSPSNNDTFASGNKTYQYDATKGVWNIQTVTTTTDISALNDSTGLLNTDISELNDSTGLLNTDISELNDSTGLLGSGGATVYANMAGLVAATGMSAGDFGLVTATNNIYVYTGAGWFKIATVQNESPTAITGVNGTYELAIDGSPTVITAVSTDPEGFPLTWSFATSGLGSIATVGQGTGEGYAIANASILSGTYTINANSAALTFKPDGTEMFTVSTNNDRVGRFTLSTAWDISTATYVTSSPNTITQVSNLTDVKFNNDGTKMYMADRDGTTKNTIYQYSLSTAWDVSTATYDSKSYDSSSLLTGGEHLSFAFNADGSAVYLAENYPNRKVYQFTLSTNFDISTASYSNKNLDFTSETSLGRPYFTFTNDGTKLFMINTFHTAGYVGTIHEYSLTTAYDVSTASYTGVSYTPAGITTGRSALAFKPDGSKMFISGTDSHTTISQFNLPIYNDNQFVINPSTDTNNAGTFTLTVSTTDGINGAVSATSNITLEFIVTIANSRYTGLLATATSAGDNNDITDSSSSNHTLSVTGDTHAGTFSPYRHGGYSLRFSDNDSRLKIDNSGDYTIPASSGSDASGDFVLDGWMNLPANNAGTILELGKFNNGILFSFDQYNNGLYLNSSIGALQSYVVVNTWQHFAVVRKGNGSNNVKVYIDGTKVIEGTQTASINSDPTANANSIIRIGGATHNSNTFLDDGSRIYNFRFVIGDSVYPSASDSVPPASISVPTEKTTAISGTKIYIDGGPMIRDASSLTASITNHNEVKVTPSGPFDNVEYDPTLHGGSITCPDGGGIKVPTNVDFAFGQGQFCIEFWWRPDGSIASQGGLIDFRGGTTQNNDITYPAILIDNSPAILHWQKSGNYGSAYYATSNFIIGNWYHIAVSRDSANTLSLYVNGARVMSTSNNTTSYVAPTTEMTIGNWYISTTGYSNNHTMSDIRIIKGSTGGREGSGFTPPTAPLTATSDTKLLIKGTDASVVDKAQGSNLELLGNAMVGSTTQVKFAGTKSMYFDSASYVSAGPVSDFNIGTGDFTIECWVYETSQSTDKSIWDGRSGPNPAVDGFTFTRITNNTFRIWSNGSLLETGSVTIQNTWVHTAVVRNNGTLKIYLDGVSQGSVSNTTNFTNSADFWIGAGRYSSSDPSGSFITGYIQDFRVANFARYTSNFTPPTESLKG